MENYKVYIIKNTINKNLYVGTTSLELDKRFKIHKMHLFSKCSNIENRSFIYKDMLNFGFNNFFIELFKSNLNKSQALEIEKELQTKNKLFYQYAKRDLQRINCNKYNSCYKLVSADECIYFKTTVEIAKKFNCHKTNVTRSINDNYLLLRKYKVFRIDLIEYNNSIKIN
jgi:esterase/lipase